jgi:hypothetical protein
MNDSLFTDDLPLVKNNKELQKIKNLHPNLDEYYIASGCIRERREKFSKLWSAFEPLADRHFLSQIKIDFHERSWEMYIGCLLKKIHPNVSSENSGPDFVVNKGGVNEFYVEAVACKHGDSADKVPDLVPATKIDDISVHDVPEDAMLLRLINSISYKAKKYNRFIQTKNKPYIIAVNKGALKHPDPEIPLILKCLFGFGNQFFRKVNGELVYGGWNTRDFITKNNGEQISMKFFEDKNNDFVSGIIYSPVDILNTPDQIGEDCVLIHNPNAKFPISTNEFLCLQQRVAIYTDKGVEVKVVK